MRNLVDQLSQYADYHRDRRNVITHFIGIPMIVFALLILMSRASLTIAELRVSLADAAVIGSLLYYLRLDRALGLAMTVLLTLGLQGADAIAGFSTERWLEWSLSLFVVGWIFQFVGHLFEGRKPAFMDDIAGLIIGPLFVLAEAGFLIGLRRELQRQITPAAASHS